MLTEEVHLARHTLRFEISGPDDCAAAVTDEYGNAVAAEDDGTFLLCTGRSYRYRVSAAGYASRSGTTGEIFGDLTVTLRLEKTWDGSYTKPELGEDGFYLIYTAEELMWFNRNGGNDDCVRLMADIVLNGEDELVNQWKPMFAAGLTREGSFNGVFDGNGHTIENLYIRLENLYTIELGWDGSPMLMSDRIDVAGMFGYFTGTVKDLAVTGLYEIIDRPVSQMADWFMLGGIAAFMDGGSITGCSTDIDLVYNIGGETTSTGGYPDGGFPEACDVYIGGIAASMTNGAVISDCYVTGDLSGFGTRTVNIGGIAGGMRKSSAAVTRCYFSGDITAQGSTLYSGSFRSSLGGIVGDTAVMGGEGGTVEYCFALGTRIDGTDSRRSEANRIVGSGAAQLRYNAASTALRIVNAELHDDENFSRGSVNGGDIDPARAVGSMTAYKAVGWDENIWQCGAGSLPRFLWQSGEPGVADCTVTVVAPEGTTVTFTGGVTDGKTTTASTVSFTVTLPAGWALDGVACANGTLSGAMGSYTVRNITGDLIITVAASVHKGDVNGDGVVDAVDAMLVLRHCAGKLTLTGGRLAAADANGDGRVNTDDVSDILKQAVGIA